MRHIGFSTGAIARGNFWSALDLLKSEPRLDSIELSALRIHEVEALVRAIPTMNLDRYHYVSFHAPSSYGADQEADLVDQLERLLPTTWPIVLHPDAIHDHVLWRRLGSRVAIENMDRRKTTGRTASELQTIFRLLPEARFCFDIGHARQCDTSMLESFKILEMLAMRLVQVHISEVNSASHHDPLSYASKLGFRSVAHLIPDQIPLIVESRISSGEVSMEIESALEALPTIANRTLLPA